MKRKTLFLWTLYRVLCRYNCDFINILTIKIIKTHKMGTNIINTKLKKYREMGAFHTLFQKVDCEVIKNF